MKPWSFPEIPGAGRMSQQRKDITHMYSCIQEGSFSDRRRGNVYVRGEQRFERTGCHCERSEAISLVGQRTGPRLLRRFTPRNDRMPRVLEWLHGGSLQA
jgi:hypothetical protein